MGNIRHKHSKERIAIDIGVIDSTPGWQQSGYPHPSVGIIDTHRGIIDRSDGDGDMPGIGCGAVGDDVVKPAAVEVSVVKVIVLLTRATEPPVSIVDLDQGEGSPSTSVSLASRR